MVHESQNQSRGAEILGVIIALMVLSTISVILRFVSRGVSKTPLWWDDYTVLIALILSYGPTVNTIVGVHYGLGKHTTSVGPVDTVQYLKVLFADEMTYALAIPSVKIAILFLYYRLFGRDVNFRIGLFVVGTVVICWLLTVLFIAIFQCKPISYFWDRTISGGTCLDVNAFFIGNSVTNLFTDVVILCMPVRMVWRLHVEQRQKIALSSIFLLGAFVCMTSIVRLTTLKQISALDITWTDVPAAIWTPVECSVGVISACLPTMRPLLGHLFYSKDRTTAASQPRHGPHSKTWPDPQPQYKNAFREANRFKRLDEEAGGGNNPPGLDPVRNTQMDVPAKSRCESIHLGNMKHSEFSGQYDEGFQGGDARPRI